MERETVGRKQALEKYISGTAAKANSEAAVRTRNLRDTCWLVLGLVLIPGAIVWGIAEAWWWLNG